LGWPVQNFRIQEYLYPFWCGRHVGTLTYSNAAIFNEKGGIFAINFVLSGGRKCQLTGNFPDIALFKISCPLVVLQIILDSATFYLFKLFYSGQINAFLVIDVAI